MEHERFANMNVKQQNIIDQALLSLKKQAGNNIQVSDLDMSEEINGYDAIIHVAGIKIYILVKNEVRPTDVGRLIKVHNNEKNLLLIANYITPTAKNILKDKGINYIDRVGNTYLKTGSTFIHINGIHNHPPTEDNKNRAFTPSGVRVIFHFLHKPELINTSYRNIAKVTNVSLGTIPKVIAGLEQEGYALNINKRNRFIDNYESLLKRWQHEYVKHLKPKLLLKKFKPLSEELYLHWKELKLIQGDQWGAEPAGNLLTNHLNPDKLTLYSTQTQQEIMKKYKWIPDKDGDISVYEKFWEVKTTENPLYCAPPIIAYADLMGSNDSRCIETANIIYEQYIQKH